MNGSWTTPTRRAAAARGQSGFTLTELIIWVGVAVSVMIAAITSYIGTARSWNGTADLARIQRDGSLAMEVMARGIRRGSSVTIGSGGDSLNIYYWTGSVDSLTARYHLDGQGCLRDMTGFDIATDVDSIRFTATAGGVVNMDLYIRDDRETANHTGDDLPVVLSSTAVCRN